MDGTYEFVDRPGRLPWANLEPMRGQAAALIRGIREASGLIQEDFAAWLGVSRKTVQRWERGDAVPDARAEAALVDLCRDKRLFGGPAVADEAGLVDALARARLGTAGPPSPPAVAAPVGLYGRAADLERVVHALAQDRLVTLTGPGGVGKTRLALAVADGRGDAVVVSLAPVRDAGSVPAAIAERLGVRQGSGQTLRDALATAVAHRPMLLVLDNFEQVRAAAPLVADLLDTSPQLRVLVTSRGSLGLGVEREVAIGPLEVVDPERPLLVDDLPHVPSVALFTERAQRVASDFALTTGNARAVVGVCARLDGLPLALELAAARMRLLSPAALEERLEHRLAVLTGGAHELPERQRTLRAVLDWSHDLLTPEEQRAFRRLGVLVGRYPVSVAEAIVGPEEERPLDVLSALVDQSLLRRDGEHLTMLETVREYAAECLAEAEDADLTRVRHRDHFLGVVEGATVGLRGSAQFASLAVVADAYDNIRAALEDAVARGDATIALRFAVALAPQWDARSSFSEGREWLERALASGEADELLRATAQTWVAYLAVLQGDRREGEAMAGTALEVWQRAGIEQGEGYALLMLAHVALEGGDPARGRTLLEESLAKLRAAGDMWGTARPLNNLGEAARAAGDLDEARSFHEEALAVCRELGDRLSLSTILTGLGHVELALGDLVPARDHAVEALVVGDETDNSVNMATAVELVALIDARAGDVGRATRWWGAAERLRATSGTVIEARDRDLRDDAIAVARAALGDERFAVAWAGGRDVPGRDLVAELSAPPPTLAG